MVLGWIFHWNLAVYPKVKVREQQVQDDQSVFSDSEESVAKVPKSYRPFSSTDRIPNVVMPKISVPLDSGPEHDSKQIGHEEESKQKLRPGSVPRPRAVLSSPDNDLTIGNENRRQKERSSLASKNRKVVENRQRDSLRKAIIPKSPENSAISRKPDDTNRKGQRGLTVAITGPTQTGRAGIRKSGSAKT